MTAPRTPIAKMSVPMTLTCGGMPTRVAPQIHSGNVLVVPAVKAVTMNELFFQGHCCTFTYAQRISKCIRQPRNEHTGIFKTGRHGSADRI